MFSSKSIVHRDPKSSAEPQCLLDACPLQDPLDYLEAGDGLEVFLDEFPSVSREQAVAALNSRAKSSKE